VQIYIQTCAIPGKSLTPRHDRGLDGFPLGYLKTGEVYHGWINPQWLLSAGKNRTLEHQGRLHPFAFIIVTEITFLLAANRPVLTTECIPPPRSSTRILPPIPVARFVE